MRPLSVLTLAVVALGCASRVSGEPLSRPNIVFVLADDLGPGDLGCTGGKVVPTPNIDRLAKEGTRFGRYYAAAPICSPSRCGLITGQLPARWKITSFLQTKAGNRACGQADFLDPAAPSLPRVLKAAGYKTAHFGKWHLGGGRDVTDAPKFAAYGYDEHAGTYESPEPDPAITATNWIWSDKDPVKRWDRTAYFVDKTLDFLKRHPGSPCFVNVWLDDPHTPWVPRAGLPEKGPNTRENLKAVTAENDRQVGRLLDGLKAQGIDGRTLVVFASDNGPLPTFKGDRSAGLRGSKLSLYEGGVRLPFLARWPGAVPAGAADETSVLAGVDVLPTFARLAGAKLPDGVTPDGEDRSAVLLGKPSTRAKPLFWEYGRSEKGFGYPAIPADKSPNVAVLDGDWKLLVNADGTGAELYDVAADRGEATNRAAREPAVAGRLKNLALDWRSSVP